MKTIAQFVQDGITTLADLQDALHTAMRLEFSTIPPYLCAQWSIDASNGGDPSNVTGMIEEIVIQEMFHFSLAGNMLTAIGGTPKVSDPTFIPSYPTHVLPGGIQQTLAVDLAPLSTNQLQVFMQIEMPEFTPIPPKGIAVSARPATIGAFYDEIYNAFGTINPTFIDSAYSVSVPGGQAITSVVLAQAAITRIKEEGEGTPGSPDQPPPDASEQLAHYYVFEEILKGQTWVQPGNTWGLPPIQFPKKVNPFPAQNSSPDPSIGAFNASLTQLLLELQTCWTLGKPVDTTAMNNLRGQGMSMIANNIRPEFLWASPAGAATAT